MPYIDIDSARKAGYSDDDIIKKISSRYPGVSDAIGKGYALDEIVNRINKRETATEPTEPQVPGEKPGYMAGLGKFVTEDIPKTFKGALDRTAERTQRIEAPTALGTAAQEKLGTKKNFLGGLVEGVAGLPERATRTVAGAVGTLAEVPGMGIELAGRTANRLTGGALGKGFENVSEAIAGSKTVQDVAKKYSELSTEAKANLGSTVDLASAFGMKGGESIVKNKISEKTVEKAIKKGISKGIKPTVIGKPSLQKLEGFYNKADDAVRTIAENKNNIELVNDVGEKVLYPKSSAEMAQAIDQTKKVIYKKYSNMALAAGDEGAKFNAKPIVDKLEEVANPSNLKQNPQVRKYAKSLIDEIAELDGASPDIIEERIKDLNSSLAGFYDGRVTKANAQVDASVAKLMREELDNKITGSIGEGYQGLKNQYGSLKSIEKEVNKRALVNARRANKSVIDFTDIFTGSDLATGILTMNPALVAKGVAGRGIKELYKSLNNPDRYIADMFKKVYKASESPITKKKLIPTGLKGLAGLKTAQSIKEEEEKKKKRKINLSVY